MLGRRLVALIVLVPSHAALPAQTPPGLSIPAPTAAATADPAAQSPAELRVDLGDAAVAAGRTAEAVDHYVAALGFHPGSSAILRKLVLTTDGDARAAWAYRWWLAAADDRGQVKLDREMKTALGTDAMQWRALAAARAAALEELSKFAVKLKVTGRAALGEGIVARWANDLAWQLMQSSPALHRRYRQAFGQACDRHVPDYNGVLKALENAVDRSVPTSTKAADDVDNGAAAAQRAVDDIAIRAARCLTGLAAQSEFEKLEGPQPPELSGRLAEARASRAKVRHRIDQRIGEPFTVEQLQQMSPAEQRAFTERHATWADPGLAVSPNGLYLVQTTCGHGTLLGAASTVEFHHRRLANWFGSDPFGDRQGLVRLVPEFEDLEAEDTPFWWAGGFQRGDLTTLRFAWGNINGLGHGLTHELTHRFDGALFSFLPAWLTEGRAVWTGAAFARAEDDEFVANYLDWESAQTPFIKGYGRPDKLEELIAGTIDDYRDNYSAGYALFVFLQSWEVDGKNRYADRLSKFMRNARASKKKPVEFFVSHFADGKEGRPKGLDEFAADFNTFLDGCYQASWGERVSWLDRYTRKAGQHGRSRLVDDEPTFSWARDRAEPWFGQRHAARAGMVLADAGYQRPAAAALLWSLQTDGWQVDVARRLAALLRDLKIDGAEWVLRGSLDEVGDRGRAPMLAGLSRLSTLLRELRAAASQEAERGHVVAARVLGSEHNRLAAACGLEPVAQPDVPADLAPLHPLVEPPRNLGLYGWTEDGLTGFEERRAAGLWFETEDGDVHVGRSRERDSTGLLDRSAHQRHAYVRTLEWQPAGHYVLRTRVHFTTSFVSGAVILGSSRRDRNVRLSFRAGDYLYSIGRKAGSTETKSVSLGVSGLWERDGNLPNAAPWHMVEFENKASYFDLEVRVDGPTMHVTAAGKSVFSYTSPDRAPIDGFVGVAMSQGAVRLQRPTVQRLDRGAVPIPAGAATGLDLALAVPTTLDAMLRRPTRGIPAAANGTLVIMLPALENQQRTMRRGLAVLRVLERFVRDHTDYPQTWALAFPETLGEQQRDELRDAAKMVEENRFVFLEHRLDEPFAPQAWLLFVDGFGVLRAAESLAGQRAIPREVDSWARRYRTRRSELYR